jgi:hydrogenase nickel incorporation protein HypB
MCTTCGCGHDETRFQSVGHGHQYRRVDSSAHQRLDLHPRAHDHDHPHGHTIDLHYGHGPAATYVPGMSQARIVRIEQDILAKNDVYAAQNRELLHDRGIFAVNLVSSPGSGKTTLLVRTIEALRDRLPICVIEGDQQTSFDADRIRATGARAIQVNTGKGCHLDASMVGRALQRLDPTEGTALMIENVGNLVCPAGFDLGEAHKVVVLSVTEGEDKPLKYSDMFRAASLMLLNKVDLLPHLQFDLQRCFEYARRVNPDIAILSVSASTGQGMEEWLAWIGEGVLRAQQANRKTVDSLKRQIIDLEAQIAHLRS